MLDGGSVPLRKCSYCGEEKGRKKGKEEKEERKKGGFSPAKPRREHARRVAALRESAYVGVTETCARFGE
jgi:hypothetical protein